MTMRMSLPEPVRSLDARVISALKPDTEAEVNRLTSYLAEVSRPESVRLIIDAICADGELAEQCFHTALTHPLGFDKFVLYAAEAYDLRLHIWWPDEKRGREDIHNHRFSLFSGIIMGELQISAYEVCRQGVGMSCYEEVLNDREGKYHYMPQQRVYVKQTSAISLSRGSAYYLSSKVLHRVAANGGALAATIFIRGIESRRTSLVIRGTAEPAPSPGIRATLDRAEAENRIRSFLKVLNCPMAEANGQEPPAGECVGQLDVQPADSVQSTHTAA